MSKTEIQEFNSICNKLSSVNLNRIMEVAIALKFTEDISKQKK